MDDIFKQEIRARASNIRGRLKGAFLYGLPVSEIPDGEEYDVFIVAVWEESKKQMMDKARRELDHLFMVIS